MSEDRSVKVTFEADVSNYMRGVKAAGAATKDFGKAGMKSLRDNGAEWDRLSTGMLKAGAVMGVGVGYAVKSFADFDQAMSQVDAVLNGTPAQMKAVENAVRKAGKASVFTSVESANAAEELAKAGISAKDIVGGALKGSLDLAAAGSIGLSDAATIGAQAMKIFGLRGKDMTHIADVLAAGANKSAADVDNLGQALRQGGLVAEQTGLTFEDTVGVLSAFADNALVGSDAGTSLKTMLQRLNPQSAKAKKLMEKLGFSAYDAQGNFVGIDKVAGELQESLKGMSAEQRNAALQVLFGSDAVRGANILYKLGEKGVQKYTKAVNDQGAASRTAGKRLDNLKGDFEKLSGAIQDLFIGSGSSGNDFLRKMVQHLEGAVEWFGKLPKPVQDAAFWMGSASGAALLLGGGLIKIVRMGSEMRSTLRTITGGFQSTGGSAGVASGKVGGLNRSLRGIRGAVGVAAAALAAWEIQKQISKLSVSRVDADRLAASLEQMGKSGQIGQEGMKLFLDQNTLFGDSVNSTAEAVEHFSNNAQTALGSGFFSRWGRSFGLESKYMDQYTAQTEQLDAALATMIRNGHAEEAQKVYAKFAKSLVGTDVDMKKFYAAFPHYNDALQKHQAKVWGIDKPTKKAADVTDSWARAAKAAGGATEKAGNQAKGSTHKVYLYGVEVGKAGGALRHAKIDADKLADAIRGLNDPFLNARDAQRNFEQAIDDARNAIKENGRSLDTNTEKGRKNERMLDDIARTGKEYVASLVDRGASEKDVRKAIDDSNAALRAQGKRLGLTGKDLDNYTKHAGFSKQETKELIDKLHEANRTHARPKVTLDIKKAQQAARDIQRNIDNLRGKYVTVGVNFKAGNVTVGGRVVGGQMQRINGLPNQFQASGGVLSGFTPGRDVHHFTSPTGGQLHLSGGEAIMRPEWTRAVGGPRAVERMNKAARSGQAFANGGVYGSALNTAYESFIDHHAPAAAKQMVKHMSEFTSILGGLVGGPKNHGTWRSLWAMVQSLHTGAILTSGFRPGAVTATGYKSGHALGKAIDVSPSKALWDILWPRRNQFRELYGPWGGWLLGKSRWAYPGAAVTMANHRNHIHIRAYADGTNSAAPGFAIVGEEGPELVKFSGGEKVVPNQAFASGGVYNGTYDPAIGDIIGLLSGRLGTLSSRVDTRRSNVKDRLRAQRDAVRDLTRARRELQKVRNRKHSPAEEARAEREVTKALRARTNATDRLRKARTALNVAEKAAGVPTVKRFSQSAGRSNRVTASFLSNVQRIAKRGYPSLAHSLLTQGDDDAIKVAAQAARLPKAKLASLAGQVDRSARLASREANLLEKLDPVARAQAAKDKAAARKAAEKAKHEAAVHARALAGAARLRKAQLAKEKAQVAAENRRVQSFLNAANGTRGSSVLAMSATGGRSAPVIENLNIESRDDANSIANEVQRRVQVAANAYPIGVM